jgi:hypothetical protein
MRTLIFASIIGIAMASQGCGRNMSGDKSEDANRVENKFATPAAAFEQTKQNLIQILNDNQRKTFGLGSDQEIAALAKVTEIPVSYLPLDRLSDTAMTLNDEGFLYTLGSGTSSKIAITVTQTQGGWMQNTVGMSNVVQAVNRFPASTRLVEVPGLEMSFLEQGDSSARVYVPLRDYSEAGISQRGQYRAPELMRLLEAYRARLEKQFGADFTNGSLDK